MTPTRGNVKAFAEKANEGSGLFMNSKDFTVPRRIRPIAWLFNGSIIDVKLFLEGWHDVKGKPNGSPVRFETDEEIPEGEFKWKMNSYPGQPSKAQVPDVAMAFLCFDYKTKSIKVATFTQKTVINQVNTFITEEASNGDANELYIPDLSKVDLIIAKTGEKTYSVQTQDKPEPKELRQCLEHLRFSWELFMQCKECFGDASEIGWVDVVEAIEAPSSKGASKPKPINKPKQAEVKEKQEEQEEEVEEVQEEEVEALNWKTVKSPRGTDLGKLTIDSLKALAERIINAENPDPSSILYRALTLACKEKEIELDDIPF